MTSMQEGEDDTDGLLRRHNVVSVGDFGVGGGIEGVLSQLLFVLLPEIEGMITFGERLDS